MTACGIKLGTDGINENPPAGFSEVARAVFTAQSSHALSGSVAIYFNENGVTDQYVLRLEGFNVDTNELAILRLRATAGGGSQLPDIVLKASSGNHNYAVNISANRPQWTSAVLITTAKGGFPLGETYGTASFPATNYP